MQEKDTNIESLDSQNNSLSETNLKIEEIQQLIRSQNEELTRTEKLVYLSNLTLSEALNLFSNFVKQNGLKILLLKKSKDILPEPDKAQSVYDGFVKTIAIIIRRVTVFLEIKPNLEARQYTELLKNVEFVLAYNILPKVELSFINKVHEAYVNTLLENEKFQAALELAEGLPNGNQFYRETLAGVYRRSIESLIELKKYDEALKFMAWAESSGTNINFPKYKKKQIYADYLLYLQNTFNNNKDSTAAIKILFILEEARMVGVEIGHELIAQAYEVIVKEHCANNRCGDALSIAEIARKKGVSNADLLIDFCFHAIMNLIPGLINKIKLFEFNLDDEKEIQRKTIAITTVKKLFNLIPINHSSYSQSTHIELIKIEVKHLLVNAKNKEKISEWGSGLDILEDFHSINKYIQEIIKENKMVSSLFFKLSSQTRVDDFELVDRLTAFQQQELLHLISLPDLKSESSSLVKSSNLSKVSSYFQNFQKSMTTLRQDLATLNFMGDNNNTLKKS